VARLGPLTQLLQVQADLVVDEPQLGGVGLEFRLAQVGVERLEGLALVGKQVGLQASQLAQAEID